ncbi:hypothetical protein EJD97_020915, partial [Solanum chilense]
RSETPLLRVSILFLSVLLQTTMTDHHTLNGPSCMTVMMVLSIMAPKQDRVYARGRSKSVALSARTSTPSLVARAAKATPKKVASGVVTPSQSDEEHTLTGTPSGLATNKEGASGSLGVSWAEETSGSAEVPAPANVTDSASSDEASSSESTPGSPIHALTSITDQPNLWSHDSDTYIERWLLMGSLSTMPESHNLFTRHRLELTARPLGRYSEEFVRDFYASYVGTLRSQIGRRAAPAKLAPLEQIVKDGQFLREQLLRKTTKKWMALHLSVDGEGADWVTESKGAIKKANLTFTAKFLWLIVRHCLSPTSVPIWHVDQLKTPLGTVDISLIRDEANELAPRRGPRPELPPLGDNLADTVAQARMATQAASTDTTPVESIPGSSTTPSSSRSAPFPTLVPLARVQKLEAQMARLLHHIQPCTQSWKIAEVHQRLDAFELRVLARPAPQVDVSILQAAVDSLRTDINMILEATVPEFEAPSAEPAEDTVMAALFATFRDSTTSPSRACQEA